MIPSLLVMAYSGAAGLNVACTHRDVNGLSISRGAAHALYDRVKAILPETIVFLPLPWNESEVLAFADYFLASRVALGGGMRARGWSLLAGAGS